MRRVAIALAALALAGGAGAFFAATRRVGPQPDGGWLVATGQRIRPAGQQVLFRGRPVDLAVAPRDAFVVAKDTRGLVFVDPKTWKVTQELSFPKGGGSLHGVAVTPDGKHVLATNSDSELYVAGRVAGKWRWERTVVLPGVKGASFPCGIALAANRAWVCLSRANAVAEVDWVKGEFLREFPTQVAPYDVVLLPGGNLAVTNWGGRTARPDERTAPSAGTPVVIDGRGVAATGTLSILETKVGEERASFATGLHPSDMALSPDGRLLATADANSDAVTLIDPAAKTTATVRLSVAPNLPGATAPTGLAFTADGKRLLVACGGANAVAVVDIAARNVLGWIPVGWYPGAVALDGSERLITADVKGIGSRGAVGKDAGRGVYQYAGSLTRAAVPTGAALAASTRQALDDARAPDAVAALAPARPGVEPKALPERAGEPSPIRHVVYIIKENRTYDQVFGDLKQGDGDPRLCLFPRKITPNHHALAEGFVLLDNFYCNGTLSADGHSWATEGNVTDHLEKSFGGFARSYTFGDDPLTYTASGFVWDNVLDHRLRVVNFGEMDYASEKPDVGYRAILEDWREKAGRIAFTHNVGVARLKDVTDPNYPGWNMDIPDIVRADIFLKRLAGYERDGDLPELTILYLPGDHTTGLTPGNPTPQAYLADNDLALGRIVEGISKSRFWPQSAIFVIEDDPQDGFDHVDGHRSPCLVISPYVRRGAVVHDFYNQTSVLHTMERILGLPPMHRMDAAAPLMRACFTDRPDLTPYRALPANVPLGDPVPARSALAPGLRRWADASRQLPLRGPDGADEDTLNRTLWHAVMGPDAAYPAHLAGAHSGRFADDD